MDVRSIKPILVERFALDDESIPCFLSPSSSSPSSLLGRAARVRSRLDSIGVSEDPPLSYFAGWTMTTAGTGGCRPAIDSEVGMTIAFANSRLRPAVNETTSCTSAAAVSLVGETQRLDRCE